MARYEVLELSFINDTLVQPGTIIEYDGKPGSQLKPIDAPKRGGRKLSEQPEQPEQPEQAGGDEGGAQ
jgi:hypothetical protein